MALTMTLRKATDYGAKMSLTTAALIYEQHRNGVLEFDGKILAEAGEVLFDIGADWLQEANGTWRVEVNGKPILNH